jgi:hypothetical protein
MVARPDFTFTTVPPSPTPTPNPSREERFQEEIHPVFGFLAHVPGARVFNRRAPRQEHQNHEHRRERSR